MNRHQRGYENAWLAFVGSERASTEWRSGPELRSGGGVEDEMSGAGL
ncbi:hypothetical protein [Neomoorella mulderi]|nr:hypothetical protein [Moorella mulderi]